MVFHIIRERTGPTLDAPFAFELDGAVDDLEALRETVLDILQQLPVVEFSADYVGFEVPDHLIIGYGLDAGGVGRALPYIATVEQPLP